ncbi:helix-turn-helix domain-containing protein [Clostridium sp. AL.422]|uniref:helix-turn-helix domain-containing protein n=1 Tax=Clostridium TaxID=1485 RepID=UPI00293DE02B|nr:MULTISPECIES: helix-turn-helix domain-containing protein [unclassified Clostridium]MDV4149417.1 helix-turn-helix domain-containing protein [Clostridium sp. AL.422]
MSRQRSMEKILESEYVTIGELVRITNSRYSTLKFYTEEGMLPFEQEEERLTRRFKREEAVNRIEEIKELKRKGYRVEEIKSKLLENNEK